MLKSDQNGIEILCPDTGGVVGVQVKIRPKWD